MDMIDPAPGTVPMRNFMFSTMFRVSAIPEELAGHDQMVTAQTGKGKTPVANFLQYPRR